MKLEVGMYVRTKDGEIGIVISSERIAFTKDYVKIEYLVFGDEIVNASNNIIDLIEVGDYVNGSEVTSIEKNGWLAFGNNDWYIPNSGGIKSIVTKEQFEAMKYEIS